MSLLIILELVINIAIVFLLVKLIKKIVKKPIFIGSILSIIYVSLFGMSFLLETLMQPNGFFPLFFLLFPALFLPFIGNCLLGGFSVSSIPDYCSVLPINVILVTVNAIFYFIVGFIIAKIIIKK
jgi:hypothetical protein